MRPVIYIKKIEQFIRSKREETTKKTTYLKQYNELKRQELETKARFKFEDEDFYPCLNDAGFNQVFDRHYVYHTAWAARKVKEFSPATHIDISSLLYFSTLISAFVPTEYYDFRPAHISLSGLKSKRADLCNLHFDPYSINSLSSMHVVEHIGLGRYGDTLDYDGDLKAMKSLARVLAPGGQLLFVVPLAGVCRIEFNAHRVYSFSQVIEIFQDFGLSLQEFAIVPDGNNATGLVLNPTPDLLVKQHYACGCFRFTRPNKCNEDVIKC